MSLVTKYGTPLPVWEPFLPLSSKLACGSRPVLLSIAAIPPEMLWQPTCPMKAMSNRKEEFVVKELQELNRLETELQTKWKLLKRAGTGMRASFVSSLIELQTRTHQVERLLDSSEQRAL
jgi:hypothetical protein